MWRKMRQLGRRTEREQEGQSLVIIAVAFFALMVIVGLAIDLGLMYVERIRLGRACDAAALAGAQELPYEEQAARRAMEYIEENGYNLDELGLSVIGQRKPPGTLTRNRRTREGRLSSVHTSTPTRTMKSLPTC